MEHTTQWTTTKRAALALLALLLMLAMTLLVTPATAEAQPGSGTGTGGGVGGKGKAKGGAETMPATGGVLPIAALGAGALLVGSGLLIRRRTQ